MNKTELKALKGRIATAIAQDLKTDASIHALAVDVLAHAATSGDFTLFARLVGDCTTAGGERFERGVRSRRLALLEWVGQSSPIRINGDGVMGLLKPTAKGYVAFNVDGARANPFWTLEGEANRRATNRPFDMSTISGRLSGIGKAIDKQVEAGTVSEDDAAVMRELSVKLNATFARFLKDKGIDLAKVKAERDALNAETPTVTDDTPAPEEQEEQAPSVNVGGEIVEVPQVA